MPYGTFGITLLSNKDAGNVKPYIHISAWNLDIAHSSKGNDSVFANEMQ